MRKLILMLFLSVSCLMQAQVMDEATALAKAKAFVQERGTATATISARRAKSTSTAPATRINKTSSQVKRVKSPSPYLYAFNVGSNDGFVIMTADNSASVIGYADEGSLDPNNMPEALKYYLQCYGAQVKQAIDEGTTVDLISARSSATNGARRAAVTVKDPIAPLCSCHWAQTMPFNYTCGYSGSDRYLVGCVPLAMAQIMYYFKYPASYADWSNMQDYYPASSNYDDIAASNQSPTNASEKAVAELLAKCGKALNVSYGTDVTTGYSSQIPSVLKGLGYSSSCQNVNKSSYSEGAFINLIYNELSNKRPVVLGGYTYSSTGHAWVCDGYSSDNYFHMNWGFNNGSDGYYTLANVAPSAQGAGGADSNNGYSSNMNAVIGITYSGAETGEDYSSTTPSTTSSTTNLKFSNTCSTTTEFVTTVTNNGTTDYCGTFTAKLTSTNGTTLGADVFYIGAGETKTITVAYSGSTSLSSSNTVVLCSGTTSLAKARPATGGIAGSSVEISIVAPTEVTMGNSGSLTWLEDECTVKVKVKNTSSSTVSGYIMGDLLIWGGSEYTYLNGQSEYAVVPANGEYITSMTFTGLDSEEGGECYVVSCYLYDNTDESYTDDNSKPQISFWRRFGYVYWTADGTYSRTKVADAGTAVVTPETAVAMQISTSNVSSVTPNSNPNTLYYIDNGVTVPSGLTGCNVITSDGTNWSSTSTTFTETSEADMKNIYIPKKFTAANVNYKRTFTKGRGKTTSMGSGWGTIALPYSPTSIECEGEELPFFTSASDTNGRFWLYRYNQVNGTQITWGYASEFKKNMPYLIAVPNDEWSTSLLNKTIEFKGSNVVMAGSPTMIASSDTYNLKFVGTQEGESVTNAYTMNADGSNFVYNASATEVKPFHAYYTTTSSTVNATSNGTMTETFVATINEITASSSKVSTPTLAEATNITSSAFTTTWEACDNATSYELTLTGVQTAEQEVTEQLTRTIPGITPLLEEDFSGFNQESSGFGGTPIGSSGQTAATNSIDDYTKISGWTANAIYDASTNAARFGTTNTARGTAFMTTPSLTAPASGNVTVAVWASQYSTNDSESMTITVGSNSKTITPSTISTYTKDNATCYIFNTTASGSFNVKVSNANSGKRTIVYYIGVYPGTYSSAAAIATAKESTTQNYDSTYTKVVVTDSFERTATTANTSYTFTGLDNSYTYTCSARATDGTKYSDWSNIINVILGQNALGDVDLDGDIDLDDLEALKAVLLESSTKAHGDTDINGSGETNIGDIPALIQMLKTNK